MPVMPVMIKVGSGNPFWDREEIGGCGNWIFIAAGWRGKPSRLFWRAGFSMQVLNFTAYLGSVMLVTQFRADIRMGSEIGTKKLIHIIQTKTSIQVSD
jgi:hypothetical protein